MYFKAICHINSIASNTKRIITCFPSTDQISVHLCNCHMFSHSLYQSASKFIIITNNLPPEIWKTTKMEKEVCISATRYIWSRSFHSDEHIFDHDSAILMLFCFVEKNCISQSSLLSYMYQSLKNFVKSIHPKKWEGVNCQYSWLNLVYSISVICVICTKTSGWDQKSCYFKETVLSTT